MNIWEKNTNGALKKVFSFKNYRQSFAFVSQVALLAEKYNHHPKIILEYNSVEIELISHDKNVVTQRDIDLAEQIDKI
ncbi:4a-hydroxytetrahydrobiopterin dehydratase [Alphaproteobacteria bacterium]|jgi:4a-hydroxytetrahydrobiopterin dehydratase|nr:4a-hydroxytetrahydrobiopterin dehydratase [Alphaproteobacteria bacterium]|tara:strand:+ start:8826 stop:9059 length:234 start_codon:yes stop_codon:yes gene_type:complete